MMAGLSHSIGRWKAWRGKGPKMKKIGEYYYFLNAQGRYCRGTHQPHGGGSSLKSVDGPWKTALAIR